MQSSWNAFSAFQVFGDHVPMDGFSLVVRISADPSAVEQMLAERAPAQAALDPELAVMMLRAGLGLILSPSVSFIYANPDETIVVLRRESVHEVGQSLEVHDHLISSWSARMALISGASLPISGRVYEFPDMGVVRKAVRSAMDSHEEQTMQRSARRLGAQLRGRGEPFHTSMVETLEEQSHLLRDGGIDVDGLPSWWWRGVAARAASVHDPNQVEIWSQLPSSEQLSALIA
ncbi:hypothetical protein [Enhygromyxa salina]|uniref:hypothetical protein n=1 Tax=Enhygromyxa salina TaxID=215803 RepID=UPI0011B212E8|nr:hypothetical protein [Enhygromyxa salina]